MTAKADPALQVVFIIKATLYSKWKCKRQEQAPVFSDYRLRES